MYKGIAFLYAVCFILYIIYTREPDFFDGEKMPATIHYSIDSISKKKVAKAIFTSNNIKYAIDASYFLRHLSENEKVEIIYLEDKPSKAKVYTFWGYWLTWQETIASLALLILLFQITLALNKNPITNISSNNNLESTTTKKRKYDD